MYIHTYKYIQYFEQLYLISYLYKNDYAVYLFIKMYNYKLTYHNDVFCWWFFVFCLIVCLLVMTTNVVRAANTSLNLVAILKRLSDTGIGRKISKVVDRQANSSRI